MLGWQVFVFRRREEKREDIARWRTGICGLRWLDNLVSEGLAEDRGGNGYPNLYAAPAHALLPFLTGPLPENPTSLVLGDDYVLPAGGCSEVVWDVDPATCSPEEMLFIEAWDQS